VFQFLDLADRLYFGTRADGEIRRFGGPAGVAAADDLCVRAASLLQAYAGIPQGVDIYNEKILPAGGGLGGGSSDAATVLLALNHLWGCGLELKDLAALGVRLGADVPLFVYGRTAMASGIGDRLEAVALGRRHYVLVFPGLSISTRAVFSDPDLPRDSRPISLAEALAGGGRNDCEVVVRKRYPAMASALKNLRQWGRPVMTGTGSGIFLPMNSAEQAISAAREIKTLYNVRAVSGVDRSPLREMLDARGY
jgi:4-diphosphocytidyl-2-C-methyl-D-erythritol kinase